MRNWGLQHPWAILSQIGFLLISIDFVRFRPHAWKFHISFMPWDWFIAGWWFHILYLIFWTPSILIWTWTSKSVNDINYSGCWNVWWIAVWLMVLYVSFPEDIRTMAWFKGKSTGHTFFFHCENPMVSYRFPLRSALGLWWSVAADFVPRPNSMPSEGIEFKVAFDGPRINWVLAKLVYSVLSSVSVFPLNVWLWIWKNHLRDRPLCRSS